MFHSELAYRTLRGACAPALRRGTWLHVDASHGPGSVVAQGADAFVGELGKLQPDVKVEHLKLWDDAVQSKMSYELPHVQAKLAMLAGNGDEAEYDRLFADIETLCAQTASSCGLIVSAPLWNYGPPWTLKRYLDCVLHPGLTFREGASGPSGLLGGGRPLVIITSAGGSGSKDHMTPWLVDVASMLGFDKVEVVSSVNLVSQDRQQVVDVLRSNAQNVAQRLARGGGGGSDAADGARSSSAGAAADAGGDEGDEADAEGMVNEGWPPEQLLQWARQQGGLSEDALESLEAAQVSGELFLRAAADDWRDEELGLEDSDVERLLELQALQRQAKETRVAAALASASEVTSA